VFAALLPWFLRGTFLPGKLIEAAPINTLQANAVAIIIAFWARLSVGTYPGIRRSYVILPSILGGHGAVVLWFMFTRFPYDRIGIALGALFHIVCLYALYVYAERRITRRIAVVPFGKVDRLLNIPGIEWITLTRPILRDARACDAIVADFAADLPDEWEAFLADAALAGSLVYQHKQLSESLTGRVELEHLSENSFGLLLPGQAYFYIKAAIDLAFATIALPLALPILAAAALAIKLEGGGPILFRQSRLGHAGRTFTMHKFRTMREIEPVNDEEAKAALATSNSDARVTRVGAVLRRWRIDELPQIFNILKGQMSWIGPRPEPQVLSEWFTSEIPFYRYRHVVKPGISGWAQVNQGYVSGLEEINVKLQYDFYYVKYFSFWLDILIAFRTIVTLMTGSGAR
jgi:lipopolysaccharide/colanic/teichoic acid biosynthesis glycosyltransferase